MVANFLAMSWMAGSAAPTEAADGRLWVYVGTYTAKTSRGIHLCHFDATNGRLELIGLVAESKNPSFVMVHPTHRFLYAVGEIADFEGKKTGAVNAFAIDPASGKLTLLNQQPSHGVGPCHVNLDRSARFALAANYAGGSIVCLPIGTDGRLGDATAAIQHHGSSINPQRQAGPHAHAIYTDPANRFVLSADLGLDQVLVYQFDASTGRLTANDPPFAAIVSGAGPRHIAFHPNGRYVYVINELNSTVTALRYDAARGVLETLQNISTLPAGFQGPNAPAEVQVHPSGKFLYGSNRGHDSLAIFSIDADTGRLTPIGHQPCGGKNPRNFSLDPSGTWLLSAHQDSDNIVVFRVDPQTGLLHPNGQSVNISMPVCVEMMPALGR